MKQEIDISVIIVNYNVELFLEQCLNSVFNALKQISGEVFVVDNNSIDGSIAMVKHKFPEVKLIENKINVGFSKANNQAILKSTGKYVLLLNPDTVVEEDTFLKVKNFMDSNPNAGGLGVRMLDGKGKFLPESKRGLPTPIVAFYKIFGLSSLFPKSKIFSAYHLGYLSEFETHKVDILSGAFMLMRKSVLDKVGLLDETFFMYGEDVDLSYRIQLGGYDNYYYPETRIIHYKGESTKKSSINYVFVFYKAMIIFAQKHFSKNNAALFSFFINLAIYFRAGLAILSRFIQKTFLLFLDSFLILGGLYLLTNYWSQEGIYFPDYIIKFALPSYAFIWILSNYYNGIYDFPIKLKKSIFGTIIGTLVILLIYGLLPKDLQFSRLFILTGTAWTILYFYISRIYLHFTIKKKFNLSSKFNTNFIIIGEQEETIRVTNVLKQINSKSLNCYTISSSNLKKNEDIGILSQLDQLVKEYQINEVIFCAKNVQSHEIINWMIKLGEFDLDFKIAQPDSLSLIGSNSIESASDLYIFEINEITKKQNKRFKRSLDILVSTLFLVVSPIVIFVYQEKLKFFKNIIQCLFGFKSIVGYNKYGYNNYSQDQIKSLPTIKNGILSPIDGIKTYNNISEEKINLIYARDYSIFMDIKIISKAWKKLDR